MNYLKVKKDVDISETLDNRYMYICKWCGCFNRYMYYNKYLRSGKKYEYYCYYCPKCLR